MNTKRLLKSILVLLVVLSILLVSCTPSSQGGNETEGNTEGTTNEGSTTNEDSSTGEKDTSGGGNEDETDPSDTECTHASTKLENVKSATCSEEGYTGDTVCSACGTTITKGSSIAKTDHSYDNGKVTKNATCVSVGTLTYTCTGCFITKTEDLPLTACTEEYHYESDAVHKIVCSVCNKSENGEHISGGKVSSVEATCTEGAYDILTCSECNENYKQYDSSKPATGHLWDEESPVVKAATCVDSGYQYFVCKNENCDEHTTPVTLLATPTVHSYTDLVDHTDATCSYEGEDIYSCEDCGSLKTIVLPKLAHNYDSVRVDGSWTYKTCSCGHEVSSFDASSSAVASIKTDKIEDEKALSVSLSGNISLEFPKEVVSELKQGADVNINAAAISSDQKESLVSSSTMSDEDKNALMSENSKIYDFGVTYEYGEMHDFYSSVTVTVPYTLADGEDPEGIVIWYVSEGGDIEPAENVRFVDPDGDGTGEVTFEVSHFSYYAVAYKETPEMRCRRGNHDYSDESLWHSQEASCSDFGYVRKSCKVCGNTILDNLKYPTAHSFGEKTQPDVTCENGGYVYRECSVCFTRENYEYIPSTGHSVTEYATCTRGAVCNTCKKTVIPAKGHSWSEWEVVVEPTDVNQGLKRRNCSSCGEIESVKLAASGDIQPFEFDSYEELLGLLLEQVLGLGNGSLSFDYEVDDEYVKMTLNANETADGYTARMDIEVFYEYFDEPTKLTLYYQNGDWAGEMVEDGEKNYYASDLDSILQLPFETFMNYAEQIFEQLNSSVEELLSISESILGDYSSSHASALDKYLEDRGCEYTTDELADILESFRALYAYTAIKLGFATNVEIGEGVEVPTKADVAKLLEAFMTKSETADGTKYTLSAEELLNNVEETLSYLEERFDMSVADVFYETFGEEITKHYPDLKDWDKLMAHLRKTYTDSNKLKDVVDDVITILEDNELITLNEIYDIIEQVALELYGEEIDAEELVQDYYDITLGELVQEMTGSSDATLSDLFDEIDRAMKETKFGDTEIDGVSYRDMVAQIREILDAYEFGGDLVILLDKNGNLLGIELEESVGLDQDGEKHSQLFTLGFKNDDSVKVTIPSDIASIIKDKIEIKYDTNGDLVISGISSGADVDISLGGYMHADISSVVTLDREMTAKLGYNVYLLNKDLWSDTVYAGSFVTDGKGNYYELLEEHIPSHRQVTDKATLTELLSDPESFLPDADDEFDAYGENDLGERFGLYSTVIGYVFELDGEWQLVRNDGYRQGSTWVDDKYYELVRNMVYVPYDDAVSSLKVSNTDSDYYYEDIYDEDGKVISDAGTIYFEIEVFSSNTVAYFRMEKGQICLLGTKYVESDSICTVGNKVTSLPEYDSMWKPYYDEILMNGENVVDDGYYAISLESNIPTYYTEFDGHYFELNTNIYGPVGSENILVDPFVKANVSDLETRILPNGKTLYVVADEGNVVAGYVEVGNNLYVQAAVFYDDEEPDVVYRNSPSSYELAGTTIYVYPSRIDLDAYITVNAKGEYVIDGDIIELYKSMCRNEGDYLSIEVIADSTVGGKNIRVLSYKTLELIEQNLQLVSGGQVSPERGLDWNRWFSSYGYDESYREYDVTLNSDGSVTVSVGGDSIVYLDFDFYNTDVFEAEDLLVRDDVESEKTGLEIYQATRYEQYYNNYLVIGGAYYAYHDEYKEIVKSYETMTPEQIKNSCWYIGDLDYQYDTTDGERVYHGSIIFDAGDRSGWYWRNEITAYFIISSDGVLSVLTGVSFDSNTLLVYEGIMNVEDYVSSLTITSREDGYYDSTSYYLESGKRLSREYWEIYEGDNYLGRIELPFYTSGSVKTYVRIDSCESDRTIVIGELTSLPEGWVTVSEGTMSDSRRTYDYIYGFYAEFDEDTYVKIGDTFISYREYMSNIYTLEDLLWNIVNCDYIYKAVDKYGNAEYYLGFDWWDCSLMELMDNVDETLVLESYYIGTSSDGREVYECNYYDLSSVETITIDDGTVVYCEPRGSRGYAEMGDGNYYYVYLIENGDGSYSVRPYSGSKLWFDSATIAGSLGIYELVSLNGSSLTISPELVRLLSDYRDYVDIYIDFGEYSYYVDFNEFESWFN